MKMKNEKTKTEITIIPRDGEWAVFSFDGKTDRMIGSFQSDREAKKFALRYEATATTDGECVAGPFATSQKARAHQKDPGFACGEGYVVHSEYGYYACRRF